MSNTEKVSSGGCDLSISSSSKTTGHQIMLVRARFRVKNEKAINTVVVVQADLSSKQNWMNSGKFVGNF